jgi:regulator of replication initiation timing
MFESINTLLSEVGTASIHKARIDLLRDRIQAILEEKEALEKENARLKQEIGELRSKVESQSASEEFIEVRDVLAKRKRGGGYNEGVFCPACKKPMSTGGFLNIVQCIPCGFISGVKAHQISTIINGLP